MAFKLSMSLAISPPDAYFGIISWGPDCLLALNKNLTLSVPVNVNSGDEVKST
ncbi:MAG: hypothetical protein HC830_01710 [Bacteroidetes bacterium]|nr:hypothetical protein [Bacteroidota bacterium]